MLCSKTYCSFNFESCFLLGYILGVFFIFGICLSCLVVNNKQVDASNSSISHAMNLLEAHKVQMLVDMLHEYLEYE
jgi:uncharacterized membrane protein